MVLKKEFLNLINKINDITYLILRNRDFGYDDDADKCYEGVYMGTILQVTVAKRNGKIDWFVTVVVDCITYQIWSQDFLEKSFDTREAAEAEFKKNM